MEVQISNLLGSPASGEAAASTSSCVLFRDFQFIGFPSEWGVKKFRLVPVPNGEFPIYWVPQRVGSWCHIRRIVNRVPVSNLLGSPASGESHPPSRRTGGRGVSNLLGSPASGELKKDNAARLEVVFPIYWVPQRVGSPPNHPTAKGFRLSFQFIGFPSEWGD